MNDTEYLRALADIKDLSYAYAESVDRLEFDLMRMLFTPDARLVVSHLDLDLQGIDQVIAGIEPIKNMFTTTLHANLNQRVRFADNGQSASSETYCVANHIYTGEDQQERKLDMGIRYRDKLEKTPAGWRICFRELLLDWQQDLPLKL